MRNQTGRLTFIGSFVDNWPETPFPEVAFAGRSNVGKSSALNKILNRKKAARVSGRPGRTQVINFFQVGDAVMFADLPGYGFARVPDAVKEQWKGMIESYLAEREQLKLVVLLVDCRLPPQHMDGTLLWGLREAGIEPLVIATKIDKVKRSKQKAALAKIRTGFSLPPGQPVPFSSLSGEGVAEVWQRIETACTRKEHHGEESL